MYSYCTSSSHVGHGVNALLYKYSSYLPYRYRYRYRYKRSPPICKVTPCRSVLEYAGALQAQYLLIHLISTSTILVSTNTCTEETYEDL